MRKKEINRKIQMQKNLKANWYIPFSAIAFFYLQIPATLILHNALGEIPFVPILGLNLMFIFGIFAFLVSRSESIFKRLHQEPVGLQILAFIASLGICWQGKLLHHETWLSDVRIQDFSQKIPVSTDVALMISLFLAVAAFPFVYCSVLYMYSVVWKTIKLSILSERLPLFEIIIYIVTLLFTLYFIGFAYKFSNGFYDGQYQKYDLIYVSDPPVLNHYSQYLYLFHGENDLRQPLFAVFSAPFVAAPYFISKIFFFPVFKQAIFMNAVQVFMLFFGTFLLAKTLKLRPIHRVCFMVLFCSTYTYLLFILMMEQYIIGYFWLCIFLYQICEKQPVDNITLWGASGALITNLILVPLLPPKLPLKNWKGWLKKLIRHGVEFLTVMVACCRLDILRYFPQYYMYTHQFAQSVDKRTEWTETLLQYVAFLRNLFLAPPAEIIDNTAWRLKPIIVWSKIGTLVLVFVIISSLLNRKIKIIQISAFWVTFSMIILIFIGWGGYENGLILYSLYFGWAFFILLFQLLNTIGEKLKTPYWLPVVCAGLALALFSINFPAIQEMVNFMIVTYPV